MFGSKIKNAEIKQLVGRFADADVYLGKKRITAEQFESTNDRGELDIVFNGQTHRFIDPEKAGLTDEDVQSMGQNPHVLAFAGDLTGTRINITKKGIEAGPADDPSLG